MIVMNNEFTLEPGPSDMTGFVSVKMAANRNLDDFCKQYVPGYDAERFEAVAIRLFAGKETVITVYAHDKQSNSDSGKLPVKKFKITRAPFEAYQFIESFNMTLSSGKYDINNMEVTNK